MTSVAAGSMASAAEPCLSARAGDNQSVASKTVCRTIEAGGIQRSYRLLAARRKGGEPGPLLIVLHGGGGAGVGAEWLTLGKLNDAAVRLGAIIAYPDGVGRNWNDGRRDTAIEAHRRAIDDVGFLGALIDALGKEYALDRGRVFIAGMSNGGMMALRFACERSDRVAAIAVVTAALPTDLECRPEVPVSLLMIAGTDDPLVPYGGGAVRFAGQSRGEVLSAKETVGFWVEHDGCAGPPSAIAYADHDPDDGTELAFSRWLGCRDATAVAFYAIKGGGHHWPGGRVYAPERVIGRATKELDASETVLTFFAEHPRRKSTP